MDEPEYFECRCHSPEHVLRLWLEEDPGDPCIYVSVFLASEPWHRRLWIGLKYVLGYKCRYGHFDEFIIDPKDTDRMIALFERLKKAEK